MGKYIVIASSVSGIRGKRFKEGVEVTEENFPAGIAEQLEKGNFIKRIDSFPEQPEVIPGKHRMSLDDVTVPGMKADLMNLKVPFPKNASKVELFEIWKGV